MEPLPLFLLNIGMEPLPLFLLNIGMEISKKQSDWANLPNDIVDLIAEKMVPPLSQLIRFGAVCKPWRTTIMHNPLLCSKILEICHRHVPLLMVPSKDKSQEKRGLYNIIDKKTYDLELTVPCNRRCCGSSYGWIAALDRNFTIKLINPFTGRIIHLPSIVGAHNMSDVRRPGVLGAMYNYNYYPFYVKKVILTDDPHVNPNNFMILALYGRSVSIKIFRDNTWVETKRNLTYTTSNFRKTDLIFRKGKCYAVDVRLGIVSVDLANTKSRGSGGSGTVFHEKIVIAPKQYADPPKGINSYIVESSGGEILTVQRFYEPSRLSINRRTVKFKVFKVQGDIDDEAMLVEVKNIGDDALFLGDNYSMSVAASRFPGCRSNSIYFTDDMDLFPSKALTDMGIFYLETGCFEPYYELDPSRFDMPPPFFILHHPSMSL